MTAGVLRQHERRTKVLQNDIDFRAAHSHKVFVHMHDRGVLKLHEDIHLADKVLELESRLLLLLGVGERRAEVDRHAADL